MAIAFPASAVMVALAGVLAVYGLVRGRARPADGLPRQLVALAVVVLALLAASAVGAPWAGVVAGAGLAAHALWDIWHLRAGRVVAPSMAEFCAVLDLVLAAAVIALSVR